MIRSFVIAGFVLCIELQPARIRACRIIRENGFEAFRSRPCTFDQVLSNRTMTAEYPLLHPEFLHLLQDHGSGLDIRPQNDGIHTGILDDLKLVTKIGIAPHELLLDPPRWTTS